MKNFNTITLIMAIFSTSLLFGQTKLVISRSLVNLDFGTGQPSSGDSATLSYYGNLLSSGYVNWSMETTSGTPEWVMKSRSINYTYDSNGNLLGYLLQLGNDLSGWMDENRYTNTYDANGHQITSLVEDWNGSSWQIATSYSSVYDGNGNLLSETGLTSRNVYTYNAQGSLETTIQQKLELGNWVNNIKWEYIYLLNDPKPVSETFFFWTNNAWEASTRDSYTYEPDGDLAQVLSQGMNNGVWENSGLLTNTYDADHNLVYWLSDYWFSGAWEKSLQQFNEFDNQSNFLGGHMELWTGTNWQTLLLGRYYYAEFVAAHTLQTETFDVFPNPASGNVTLTGDGWNQALLFDQQGRQVYAQTLQGQGQENLLLSHLPAGNYFLQVQGEAGKMGVKPLIIRR